MTPSCICVCSFEARAILRPKGGPWHGLAERRRPATNTQPAARCRRSCLSLNFRRGCRINGARLVRLTPECVAGSLHRSETTLWATLRPEQMQQRVCTNHLVGGGEQRWRHGTLACTSNQPVGATPGNRTHDLSDRFCCKSGRPNYRPRNGRQAEIAALIRRAVLAARNT
jgi:hypothetical protein